MTNLRAFHNDQRIKDKFLARLKSHRAADELVKGIGWENGKGCAVGCTLDAYDHSLYPTELGLPEWLAGLEDAIFEGLPNAKAMAWPEQFLKAIMHYLTDKLVKSRLRLTLFAGEAFSCADHKYYLVYWEPFSFGFCMAPLKALFSIGSIKSSQPHSISVRPQ